MQITNADNRCNNHALTEDHYKSTTYIVVGEIAKGICKNF